MKLNYTETKKYWDYIFQEQKTYEPSNKLPFEKIEQAIKWLCKNSKSILDFGCGTGRILNRCLDYGVDSVYGIDLSENAIKLAQKIMDENNFKDKSKYICGGMKALQDINDNIFDGVVLFNIIDNLKPEDGKLVIKEINRILKTNGKIILKLNPYYSPQMLEENDDIKEISNNFYKESTGLFLWNISNSLLEEIITPYFNISSYEEVEFKEYNTINRLFCLEKK